MYDDLNKMKAQAGYSLADIVKADIDKQALDVEMAYWTGYEDAEKSLRVTYRCSVCSKAIVVNSDEEKKAIARYMSEHSWHHNACIR